MKKIVALALSLVMALALCTTAFAASYSDAFVWGAKGWEKKDLNGVSIAVTSPTEVKVDGKVVEGCLGYYTIDGTDYVEVAKADATFQMKVDGKVVYLAEAEDLWYDYVGKEVKAGTKCGEYDKDEYGKTMLVKVDDDLYVIDDGETAILVNGKIVYGTIEEDPVVVEHTWATVEGKVVLDYDAEKLAEVKGTVVCKTCGQKATVTNDKGAVPTNATCIYDEDLGVYMFWVDGAAADAGNGTSSPKTFDAGIAMYVGMSLMSVAGSAVVIGKKKEF